MVCAARADQISSSGDAIGDRMTMELMEIPMTMNTTRSLLAGTALAAALAVVLALPVGTAIASELDGASVGTTAAEITESLTAKGYEVRKVEPEDGMLEAYALKDGHRYEVYVDTATGLVSKVEAED
jgi:hypothetical protein